MLNTSLYQRLKAQFGRVRIANSGQRAVFRVQKNERGSWGQLIRSGEEYHVNCPFCGDKRGRLYLSYLYGSKQTLDGQTVRFGSGLAHCHNETLCMQERTNRRALWDLLMGKEEELDDFFYQPITVEEEEQPTVIRPRNVIPLRYLPPDHKAIRYLRDRRFDIGELDDHGLCYCSHEEQLPIAENRIFIPIYDHHGDFVGGQFRLPYDPKKGGEKRYLTIPNSHFSHTFYNISRAMKYPEFVVIVEGFFDALRIGDQGIAMLGSELSDQRLALVFRYWKKAIFLPDPDLFNQRTEKTIARVQEKARLSGREFIPIRLKGTRDPADYSREGIWELLRDVI